MDVDKEDEEVDPLGAFMDGLQQTEAIQNSLTKVSAANQKRSKRTLRLISTVIIIL